VFTLHHWSHTIYIDSKSPASSIFVSRLRSKHKAPGHGCLSTQLYAPLHSRFPQSMEAADDLLGQPERTTRPLPPLQTAHSYMYMTPKQQQHQNKRESLNHEKPSRWSSSKNLAPNADNSNPSLKRRPSSFGLFGLFGRNKAPESEATQQKPDKTQEGESDGERPQTAGTESTDRAGSTASVQGLGLLPIPETPIVDRETQPIQNRSSRPALRPKPSFKTDIMLRTPKVWDPPPLFQAYPQAVKYATLRAPTMSAEAILPLNNERKSSSSKRKHQSNLLVPEPDGTENMDLPEKRLKRRTSSEMVSRGEWTDKTYVLVTSGYLLQYAGQGAHDRLPEKILPLSKDSAAFASDAIPGKYFVLQVSQVVDDDGAVSLELSRSVFKRLGIKSEMKRSTSTFLLVLEDPEQMSEWLVVVRKEIEAMGSLEYRPDVVQKGSNQDIGGRLQHSTSQRYNVKRDPNRFSVVPSVVTSEPAPDLTHEDDTNEVDEPVDSVGTMAFSSTKRQSVVTQKSTDSPYTSDTNGSIDQVHLDKLRESPTHSYASTGVGTTPTSRQSSVDHSPTDGKPETFHDVKSRLSTTASAYTGPLPTLEQEVEQVLLDRESDQATPTPTSRPVSTALSHGRAASPTPPNFSVPTFSKRYSNASNSPPLSVRTRVPSIIMQVDTTQLPVPANQSETPTNRVSVLGELLPRPVSSSRSSRRNSGSAEHVGRLGTPPKSSGSWDRPRTSEGEKQFSRRFSSLEYARGISPIPSPKQIPSPHPPPTAALPPLPSLPSANSSGRASPNPPPKGPLPPLPTQETSPRSSFPPHNISLQSMPINTSPLAVPLPSTPPAYSATAEPTPNRILRRPVSTQVRRGPSPADNVPPPPRPTAFKPAFVENNFQLTAMPSPPQPTRSPPLPPPPPKVQPRKSMPGLGWEPSPVYSSPTAATSKISTIPSAGNTEQGAAPHPFIPPIRVSERRSRGSLTLDGPWNAGYSPPKRTYLDMSFN